MRTLLAVALVSALAAPDAAHAAWWSRGHRSGPSSAPRAAGAPRYAPAPPRYAPAPGGMRAFVAPGPAPYRGPAYAGYAAPAPYPAPAYGAAAPAYASVAVAPRPLWWSGWSWGSGYYPVIGALARLRSLRAAGARGGSRPRRDDARFPRGRVA
jgi:hypothetical protein